MVLLSLSDISKNFGAETLFDKVSFNVEEGHKIGLTGVNGAGKTTLFKILLDDTEKSGGTIYRNKNLTIGYMEQHINASSDATLYTEVLSVFSHIEEIEKRLSHIAGLIHAGDGDIDALVSEQYALQQKLEDSDGFTYKSRTKSCLMGLGFSESEFNMPFNNLSGGQKTRAVLCKLLLGNANLLLLDEPTNHLDIQSVNWLESFLRDCNKAFIVVSHDRYFLDRVTNRTFEIENGRLSVYESNYSDYAEQKRITQLTEERNYENTVREIERLRRIVKQQRQWNREKNIRTAESKLKIIERLENGLIKPQNQQESIHFSFTPSKSSGNEVLKCDNLSMAFGEKRLFDGLDLFIKRGERVFLLGPNGCGKTTLFRLILNELKALSGEIKIGANVETGYYAQAQDNLNPLNNIIDEIHDDYPSMTETEIRNALAAFLFKGEDVYKDISALSGGERARVLIMKIMLGGYNLLLMDEPTNHLDIKSREALEDALSEYEGTLFIVSHDRYFINRLADRICYMDKNGLTSYDGDYDYFAEKHAEKQRVTEQKKETNDKNDYAERKAQRAALKKLERQIALTEDEIADVESRIEENNKLLLTEEYATDYVKATEVTNEIAGLEERLSELYEKWEALDNEKNGN